MEFLYSITTYKCGVYNIPEKLQMITTFFPYYGTNLVFSSESRTVNNFKFCMFTGTIRTIIGGKFQIDSITVTLFSGSRPNTPPPPPSSWRNLKMP